MLVMEAANVTGFVTAIIGFLWCLPLVSLRADSEYAFSASQDWEIFFKWAFKWVGLYTASNAALILSGLLTDGILVNCCEQRQFVSGLSYTYARSGALHKFTGQPNTRE